MLAYLTNNEKWAVIGGAIIDRNTTAKRGGHPKDGPMRSKIIVSLLTKNQEFQCIQASDAQAAAQRMDASVEVLFAENNMVRQISEILAQINSPQDERPLAVVVEPVKADALEKTAHEAAQAGIGWITLGCRPTYIDSMHAQHPEIPISAVAVDNERIGEIQAMQYKLLLPSGGKVMYIQGPSFSASSIYRLDGVRKGLVSSSITIVKMLTADWTEEGAERAVAKWFSYAPESFLPDLVGAQNDAMAVGARRAFMMHKPGCIMSYTGCDGLRDGGRQLVDDGALAATIIKPPEAGTAVELVVRASRGERIPSHVPMSVESYPDIDMISPLNEGPHPG